MSQEYIEITERTVSEAITVACQKLAVPSERLEYEVIDPGKTGFLGIGSRAARIRARVKKGMQESTEIDTSAIISGVLKGEEKREEISEPVRNTGKKEKNHPGVNREKKEALSEKARKPERAEKEEKPEKQVRTEKPARTEKTERPVFEKENRRGEGTVKTVPEAAEKKDFASGSAQDSAAEKPNSFRKEKDAEAEYPRRRGHGRKEFSERGAQGRGRNHKRSRRHEREDAVETFSAEESAQAAAESRAVPKKRSAVPVLTDEQIEEIRQRASDFLLDVFHAMDLEAEVDSTYDKENGILTLDMKGENMGVLIGKRGQTLDSLQYLVSLVVNKGVEGYIHVKADTENYRERRKKTLENLAKNIASRVKRSRTSVALEPMNPYERRIIHSALQGDRYVTTYSEGDEPYRKVIVTMKEDRKGTD